jgi:SAM-dependent methyltransferase
MTSKPVHLNSKHRYSKKAVLLIPDEYQNMPRLSFAKYRRGDRFTHYLFRFPAKFHPPAVRYLIDQYTRPGDSILDPFCGSGTLLVEALIAGRNSVGIDVDPVAAFISRVKSAPIDPGLIEADFRTLMRILGRFRRSPDEYDRRMFEDISNASFARWAPILEVPAIPNVAHWFRKYVALDLAKIRNAILQGPFAPSVRNFFLGCFASIIRNSSNADPVPVSGLEVTAHMRRLEAKGRRVDPFELFEKRVKREIMGMRSLWEQASDASVRVLRADATKLRVRLGGEMFDAVITSPPYNTAVDYYRRHTLEMYWLGHVSSAEDRVKLAQHYLGRMQVRKDSAALDTEFGSPYVENLISQARHISAARERAAVHYCASMQKALSQTSSVLKRHGRAIFVVGNSQWNGRRVKATRLLVELAKPAFRLVGSFSYPSYNRYMSYTRHNGANINREYVLVFEKVINS